MCYIVEGCKLTALRCHDWLSVPVDIVVQPIYNNFFS